ncbi:MAG: CsbD family protein, partial [Nitrospirota bacterium]
MNDDILKGKWNEIRGGVKAKWGKLTADDLTEISGNQKKLLGILQKRYGYAKEDVERQYRDFMNRLKKR